MIEDREHEGDSETPDYGTLINSAFFSDTAATDERLKSERKRAKSPKQRINAKKRPLTRTEFIGFRTTPEIAGAVKTLKAVLRLENTTEVMERAIEALQREHERS